MKNRNLAKKHNAGQKARRYYTSGSASQMIGAPKGIRIPVTSLKGWCPRPLDDGGSLIRDKGAELQAQPSQESQTLYSYSG